MNHFSKSLCVATMIFSGSAFANLDQDRESIKKMAGCYEVNFAFTETLALQKDYEIRKPYREKAYEWVTIEKDDERDIILQHILMTPMGPIKHWRQDWKFEDKDLYVYRGDFVWMPQSLDDESARGQWTQAVYQVDDSPRYECSAPWIHWGKNHYWECETWSPLPRREEKRRQEYNVLIRENRQKLTEYGWLHRQENRKVKVQNDQVQHELVMEDGHDDYKRVDDSFCVEAKGWWLANRSKWSTIRDVWQEYYDQKAPLRFLESVEGQKLWQRLFHIAEPQSLDERTLREQVRAAIDTHLILDHGPDSNDNRDEL